MGFLLNAALGLTIFFSYQIYRSMKPMYVPPPVPNLKEKWWGPGREIFENRDIVPFKINISEKVLIDLEERLKDHVPFQEPLEGVKHHYGINTDFLKTVIDFWHKKYNWKEREDFLNQYPQFKVQIQGLKIHFMHIKPKKTSGMKVLPMMLLHGWPGSVREFYEIIPILTNPHEDRNFLFELVIPSLPGFGFSDAAVRPGLSAVHMAVILRNLMEVLGFSRYYVQGGGGIGGVISQYLSILYPEKIVGVHSNFCFVDTPKSFISIFLASIYPPLFVPKDMASKVFPLKQIWTERLVESGHLHIQATKPDTIGVALRDSPVGLAAYILEKFITWTNPEWKDYKEDKLHLKYTLTNLLDNVMIYWVTGSITTSMRVYAEHFHKDTLELGMDRIPIKKVPSGCMRFWHDVMVLPEFVLREKYYHLIHLSDYDTGHFAAFEVPAKLGLDIFQFVKKVEELRRRNY